MDVGPRPRRSLAVRRSQVGDWWFSIIKDTDTHVITLFSQSTSTHVQRKLNHFTADTFRADRQILPKSWSALLSSLHVNVHMAPCVQLPPLWTRTGNVSPHDLCQLIACYEWRLFSPIFSYQLGMGKRSGREGLCWYLILIITKTDSRNSHNNRQLPKRHFNDNVFFILTFISLLKFSVVGSVDWRQNPIFFLFQTYGNSFSDR